MSRRVSPYATGGGGTVLEHAYGAGFLVALLLRRPVPGLGDEFTPNEVGFQQPAHVDDLVVVGQHDAATRILFVAVRRAPRMGAGDPKFVSLMVDFLRMLSEHPVEFDTDQWRLGLAVAGPHTGAQQLRELARLARRQRSGTRFRAAVAMPGATTGSLRERLRLLEETVAKAVVQGELDHAGDDELTWRFLRSLRILDLRLEGDDAADRSHLVADLAPLTGSPAAALDLWRHLVDLSAGYATAAATVDSAVLHRDLTPRTNFGPPVPALAGAAPATSAGSPPALPGRFVARADLVTETITRLVDGPDAVVALLGMGGAGKSTIARATVADHRIKAAFPDGVIWLDLGPEPDITLCLSRVAAALGDTAPVTDATSGSRRMRELLAGRRCLLVLDNLWQFDQLRSFPVDGTARLLATTRLRDALFTDAGVVAVDLVAPPLARAILASHAGTVPKRLPPDAEEVVRLCGGLVLALALAGGMVAEGHGWESVARRLREADLAGLAARFADYPHSDLLAALDAGFRSLPEDERSRYAELTVFEGRGQVPLAIVRELWQATARMDTVAADDLMTKLARCSLVQLDLDTRSCHVHGLLIEFTRTAIGAQAIPGLHSALAEALLARWVDLDRGPSSHQVGREDPAQRYTRTALVSHFIAGGDDTAVARLLGAERQTSTGHAANAWYELHELAGGTADYLADVRAWWRHAAAGTDAGLEHASTSFAIEARCALIIGSVHSRAGKIPPELLRRLVVEGLWSAGQAVAHVGMMPDRHARAEAIAIVLPLVPPHELTDVLAVVRGIDEPSARAFALTTLLSYLPAERHEHLADAALAALAAYRMGAGTVFEYERNAGTLATLAPHLTPRLLTKALDIARGFEMPTVKADSLMTLAPFCARSDREELAREVVDIARAVDFAPHRPSIMALAIPHLDGETRDAIRSEFLDAVRSQYPENGDLSYHLEQALPGLPEKLRREVLVEALEFSCAIKYDFHRDKAFKVLAAHLDPDLAELAREHAVNLFDGPTRLIVVSHLASRLPEDARRRAFVQVLRAVRDLDDRHGSRARVLKELGPLLPGNLLTGAVDIARTVAPHGDRADVLAALAPHVPERLRQLVLGELLAVIRSSNIRNYRREELLIAIAPHLPGNLVGDAVARAEGFGDPHSRVRILSALVARSPGPDRRALVRKVLDEAQALHSSERADCVQRLAPHLPSDLMPAAFDIVRTIEVIDQWSREEVEDSRQEAIAALAAVVPSEQLLALLHVARTVDTPSERAQVMTSAARRLPAENRTSTLDVALTAARAIQAAAVRADCLTDLLPLLPPSRRPEVLDEALTAAEAADALEDSAEEYITDGGRARRWTRLVPYLNGHRRAQVLAHARSAAYAERDDRYRAVWIASVARYLPEDEARQATADAVELRTGDWKGLGKSVDLARELPAELLVTLLNPRGIVDMLCAESERIVAVAPQLPAHLLDLAVTTARAFETDGERAGVLTSLLPRFEGAQRKNLSQEALDAARSIEDTAFRASALIALVPHVVDDEARRALLHEVIDAAREAASEQAPERSANALISLLPQLPDDLLPLLRTETLAAARSAADLETRCTNMVKVAQHFPEPTRSELYAETMALARTMVYTGSRNWVVYEIARTSGGDPPDYVKVRLALDLASGVGREPVLDALDYALDEPEIVQAVCAALGDVQRWWG